MPTRVRDHIEARTRAQCSAVDAAALAFIASCTPQRYVEYLVRAYGFEAPLESACAMNPALLRHTGTVAPRTRFIAQDLVDLGFPVEKLLELEPCPLAPFRDLAQGFGWVFVAERNVLANRACHQHLRRRSPDLAAHASYLDCYGTATAERWRAFGAALEHAVRSGVDPERIADAAAASFDQVQHWLRAS